jgi:hypothetical protein
MVAHVRVVYASPEAHEPRAPPTVATRVGGGPCRSAPLCPACGVFIHTRRLATYCSAKCRARASRNRREEKLETRVAQVEAVLGQAVLALADLRRALAHAGRPT